MMGKKDANGQIASAPTDKYRKLIGKLTLIDL